MEKNSVYYTLLESMEQDLCPLCYLTEESVKSTMGSILYEGMTDFQFRSELKKSRGFCHHHAQVFFQEGDALAHALVYSDALRGALEDAVNDDFSAYDTEKDCYFCKHARKTEELYASALTEAFLDAEFLEQYKKGGMLCMHHLGMVRRIGKAKKVPEEQYVAIAQATVDKYQALISHLDEIQRKNDYRYTNEAWTDAEKVAWKRAVDVICDRVGLPREKTKKKGLFGKK